MADDVDCLWGDKAPCSVLYMGCYTTKGCQETAQILQ